MAFKRVIIWRVGPLSWLLEPMVRMRQLIVLFSVATLVALVLYYMSIVSRYEKAFSLVKPGESISSALKNFGTPSHVQQDEAFPRYSSLGCTHQCYKRFWWESPFLKGLEAWSVDVDDKGVVIDSAHWVSP